MTDEAKQARAEYQREYKRKNAEKINAYNRAWRKANPEKTRQYNQNYWQKKANEMNEAET